MRSQRIPASLCVGVALLGILVAGCDREYRQIVVVDDGQTETVTWGREPRKPREILTSGRTLIFRTDGDVPGIPKKASGKAGRVYRVNDALELEEVGEFQLSMPNDTLAYQFGT